VARELDFKAIRDYKRRALNFHLDVRRPEALRLHGQGAPGKRPSLNEIVREKLMARPLDSDVDRAALVERAIAYLDEAQLIGAAPTGLLDT
jgi:DNA repair protein SbcD/Mre11